MSESTENRSIMALADLATPMAIRAAATLGLVEHAGDIGATASELAARTSTFRDSIERLLNHLVSVGVFELDAASSRYRATRLGAQMHPNAEEGVKPLLDMNSAGGRGELAFVDLLAPIQAGISGYLQRYGRDFWADLGENPHLRDSFDAQMNWRFQGQSAHIAANFEWGRFNEIIDVGGGDGALLTEILRTYPTVRGTIVDLAPTAAAAIRRFANLGLTHRATAASGSFFDPLPTGADAYLLCDILHDWSDEHCRSILTRCRTAAAPGGTLIVIEPVLGHGADTRSDLIMMAMLNGQERTLELLSELISNCGFIPVSAKAVSSQRMALEFRIDSSHVTI